MAVTAYATPADRIRALQQGFDAHLTKPVDADQMVTVVGALAARRTPAP